MHILYSQETQKQELSCSAACLKPANSAEDDKESQAEGVQCPEATWLPFATQPVCGHAGALEQRSAPDEHVYTQTYRKKPSNTPSLIYTMSSQLPTQQQTPIHHPIRGSSILMLQAKMRACVGVQRGGNRCYTGSIPHPVCADRRESCCCCSCVRPGSFLMAAGSQVGRQRQRCVRHTRSCLKPVSQPPCATSDHQGLIHNLTSNEYFLNVQAKVVFDEILIWWLIFAYDILSNEIKKERNFPYEASCWSAPPSNFTHKTFIN